MDFEALNPGNLELEPQKDVTLVSGATPKVDAVGIGFATCGITFISARLSVQETDELIRRLTIARDSVAARQQGGGTA